MRQRQSQAQGLALAFRSVRLVLRSARGAEGRVRIVRGYSHTQGIGMSPNARHRAFMSVVSELATAPGRASAARRGKQLCHSA